MFGKVKVIPPLRQMFALLALFSIALGCAAAAPAPAPAQAPSIIEFARAVFTERATSPNATVILIRSGDTKAGASVELLTSNLTAVAEVDYLPHTGPVVFAPGQTTARLEIQLLNNPTARGNRSLQLALANPVDARLGVLVSAQLVLADPNAIKSAWMAFGLDRIPVLNGTVFDIPFWQFLASLIYIFLAFYISKLIDYLIRERLKHWTRKTKTELDDLLLEILHGPLKVIAFVILIHLGLRIFIWPDWVAAYVSKTLQIVVAISITWMLVKIIDLLTAYWKQRTVAEEDRSFAEQLLPIIRNSLKIFVIVVATLVTLQNLGLNITSLITSLGIGGLALALAAQDTLSNFFGAVVILVDKPFHIGDDIQMENVTGKIESIGFRSTRLRNLDGHLVSIPNKTIGNATITNIAKRPNIRTVLNLTLDPETSAAKIEQAIALLTEIFRAHKMTHDLAITFDKFAGAAPNLNVVHWWKGTDANAYAQGMQEINLDIKKRFDEARISFAIPSQTVFIRPTTTAAATDPSRGPRL